MRRLLAPVLALLFLDASVTFSNWWPTPAVYWHGAPSVELAVLLLVLVIATSVGWIGGSKTSDRGPATNDQRPRTTDQRATTNDHVVRWLSAAWVVLMLGRYVDVTAPALWGRELNFYWDLRFLPDVAAMLIGATRQAVLIGSVAAAGIVLLLTLLYLAVRWAFRQVMRLLAAETPRRVVGAASALAVVLFAMQAAGLFGRDFLGEPWRLFPRPVTQVYARQARLVVQAMSKNTALPPSPALDANLARVQGADVFLFFIESYGAVTFDNPAFEARLRRPRAAFETAIRETGRDVVSAFVESPTFGGSSWFAHITFLSGIKVADPDMNALLMTEHRPTLPTNFAQRGYRTVAMMPGLWYPWPEGAFYGFQDIYNGPRMDYKGPSFGWWDMPDQFTLAKLDEQETSKASRPPLFVFYPTTSTHTPFSPLPPYQPDWATMLTPNPYTAAELEKAYVGEPDYMDLGPGYADSVAYAYETFAGYLRQRAGRDYVMILIGDHQPPALVSGEGAPWDVPMHVITNRPAVLDSLAEQGFTRGLTPARQKIGDMHEAVPRLLHAFSEP